MATPVLEMRNVEKNFGGVRAIDNFSVTLEPGKIHGLGGSRWFRGLALPMIGWAGVLVFLLSFLLRGGRRSTLSAIALIIGAAGLLAMGIEFCIDRYFRGVWQPGWSLIVLAVCVGLIIPLRIVRRVPSLREEARRRFNL